MLITAFNDRQREMMALFLARPVNSAARSEILRRLIAEMAHKKFFSSCSLLLLGGRTTTTSGRDVQGRDYNFFVFFSFTGAQSLIAMLECVAIRAGAAAEEGGGLFFISLIRGDISCELINA